MVTRYCDPLAVGLNNGTSQANAWQTLQLAADNAAAGDTVLCRHTNSPDETLAAVVDFDTTSGVDGVSRVAYVGVNTSWTEDGTRYELDANSAINWPILMTVTHNLLRNFDLTDADFDGLVVSGAENIFVNIYSHANSRHGFNISGSRCCLWRCIGSNNTGSGQFDPNGNNRIIASMFQGNTANGADDGHNSVVDWVGCLFIENTLNGSLVEGNTKNYTNCVFDANGGDGMNIVGGGVWTGVIMCRFTNHASGYGINADAVGRDVYEDWNIFYNNNDGELNNVLAGLNSRGDDGEHTHDDVAGDGYVNAATDDYNIDTGELYRAEPMEVAV